MLALLSMRQATSFLPRDAFHIYRLGSERLFTGARGNLWEQATGSASQIKARAEGESFTASMTTFLWRPAESSNFEMREMVVSAKFRDCR